MDRVFDGVGFDLCVVDFVRRTAQNCFNLLFVQIGPGAGLGAMAQFFGNQIGHTKMVWRCSKNF